jgi:FixJ family two-component response regulator
MKGVYVENSLVLIVDDDKNLCELFGKMLISKGIYSKNLNNPLDVVKEICDTKYHVILLDIIMPEMNGLNVLDEINKYSPESKVIIMTGYADKNMAINALKMGAFDLLEKPTAMDLLYHAVRRAIDMRNSEIEHERILDELRSRNQILIEMNDTLAEVMKAVERIRQTTEKRIIQQIRTLIIPFMEELRKDKNLQMYGPQFAKLIGYIEEIASGLVTNLQSNFPLSPQELRVALMIKDAMKNQEIARCLHISLETVKAYRRNIRKKFGLTGTRNNLHTYLDSLQDDTLMRL